MRTMRCEALVEGGRVLFALSLREKKREGGDTSGSFVVRWRGGEAKRGGGELSPPSLSALRYVKRPSHEEKKGKKS